MKDGIINEVRKVLKNNIRILLISGLVSASIIYLAYVLFAGVKYEAISRVFVGKEKFVSDNSTYSNEEIKFYQRVLSTFKEISKSNGLLNSAIINSGVDIKEDELANNLTVDVINKTQIMEFRITNKDADSSYNLLYSYVKEFINTSKTYFKNSNIYVIEQPYVRIEDNETDMLLMLLISFSFGVLISGGVLAYKNLVFSAIYNKETLEELTAISCIGVIPNDI